MIELYVIVGVGAASAAGVRLVRAARIRRRTRTWVTTIQRATVEEALRADVDRSAWR